MISYLEGKIIAGRDDRITLLVGGIGYEVLIPAFAVPEVMHIYSEGGPEGQVGQTDGGRIKLYISFNQTERQPKPVLVGFLHPLEKEFFELFISVEDIGPAAAIKALTRPVREIARFIEAKDTKSLKQLKGIGERKAEKIIATLKGKAAKFALIPEAEAPPAPSAEDFIKDVEHVLVSQLGHKAHEARKMIEDAMKANPSIASAEALFEEVYRSQRGTVSP